MGFWLMKWENETAHTSFRGIIFQMLGSCRMEMIIFWFSIYLWNAYRTCMVTKHCVYWILRKIKYYPFSKELSVNEGMKPKGQDRVRVVCNWGCVQFGLNSLPFKVFTRSVFTTLVVQNYNISSLTRCGERSVGNFGLREGVRVRGIKKLYPIRRLL